MKHIIEFPDEIEQALEKRAGETGDDIARVIELAVAAFVCDGAQASTVGRRPDPPMDVIESAAPFDLPRTAPRPIAVDRLSRRLPDAIADPT